MQLARWFDRVTLLEPDPDMLAAARSHAAAASLSSVDFVRATAEELPELGLSLLAGTDRGDERRMAAVAARPAVERARPVSSAASRVVTPAAVKAR